MFTYCVDAKISFLRFGKRFATETKFLVPSIFTSNSSRDFAFCVVVALKCIMQSGSKCVTKLAKDSSSVTEAYVQSSKFRLSIGGTISKFNRLGRQAGFVSPTVTMIRTGTCYNHEPNAIEPLMFRYVVDESSGETWAEGMSMFHNPNALHPVPRELFPSIAHHDYIDGQIHSEIPEFYVYSSITHTINA